MNQVSRSCLCLGNHLGLINFGGGSVLVDHFSADDSHVNVGSARGVYQGGDRAVERLQVDLLQVDDRDVGELAWDEHAGVASEVPCPLASRHFE